MMATDFDFTNHGSLCTLRPLTDEARAFLDEHIPEDALYHGESLVLEPRYVQPILDGICDEGLTVQ